MQLKEINWLEKQFEANGKKYVISPKLSIQRSVYAEEAKIELETGVRIGQTFEGFRKIYDCLQEGKFADAAVETYNRLNAIDSFFQRPLPALRLCACFLNTENEDPRTIDDAMVQVKIEDWQAEGISMNSFFLLAVSFIKSETTEFESMSERLEGLVQEFTAKMVMKEVEEQIPNIPTSK